MNTLFTRFCLLCLTLVTLAPAMAYSTDDCDVAEELADQDILVDQGNCRDYNLDRTITRQEVAAIGLKVAEQCEVIDRIPDLDDYDCENIYDDVTRNRPNSWACRAIELLSEEGILTQSRRDFRPLRSITRAESLAIMLDAGDIDFRDTIYDNWRFTGTGAVSWQKPLMQFADDENIITSISSFRPNQAAYRKDVFRYAQEAIALCDGDYNNDNDDDYYYYDNGYDYDDDSCGVGSRWSNSRCVSCTTKPSNSRYDERGTCDWTCNSGYRKSGSKCVYNDSYNNSNDDDCEKGEYEINNRCYACNSKPSNSKYTSYGSCSWSCNSGYIKNGNYCERDDYYDDDYYDDDYCGIGQYNGSGSSCYSCDTKPSNAYYTSNGSCNWSCNNGYYKSGNICVRDYDDQYNNCSVGQYTSGGNTCYSCDNRPSNAYYTTQGSCDWSCNSGYYRNGNSCVSSYNNTTCGIGQYTSGSTCYSCNSAPSNGYYTSTNSCDWSCNSGYYKSGSSCVANQITVNGQCGSQTNTCLGSSTFQDTNDSTNYANWNCVGSGGGTTAYCSNSITNNQGVCSGTRPANSYVQYGAPATGTYTWSYDGSPTAPYQNCTYACTMGYTYSNGQCIYNTISQSVHGQCSSTLNQCASGSLVDTSDSTSYHNWSCTGTNGGNTASCSLPRLTIVGSTTTTSSSHTASCSGTVSCRTTKEGQRCTTNKCPVGCVAEKNNRGDGYNDINYTKYSDTCSDQRCVNGKNSIGNTQTLSVSCVNA